MRFAVWMLGLSAAVALLLPCGARAQDFFSDVPDEHWAYEAIDYLQQAGLVEGFPDNTFRGERSFTRYEMAMVIARIFTKIQDWQALMLEDQQGQTPPDVDLAEVYARLDRLSDEFRDELAALGARISAVEDEQERMSGELDDIRSLIEDSGLSGVARWRAGGYINTGSAVISSEPGFESHIQMTYNFEPDPDLDFKLSLTATELEGSAGTGFIPGANNETGSTSPLTPPLGRGSQSSSFVIDEANFVYCWDGAPDFLGEGPRITGGRQYFSQGEFGLAGDNGWRSNFGVRLDTDFGSEFSGYTGYYRTESITQQAVFATQNPPGFQSSAVTLEGDDFLIAGLEYHTGEAQIPGHDYKLVLRADYSPNGYGAENYIGVSGNAEIPWFKGNFLNGIRGEWVYMLTNVSNQDPDADLGLNNSSWIVELDLFNNGKSRLAASFAQIAQIEGLPVYANVDNDPFSEWDFTVNSTKDAFNLSREGRNYLPADFSGFGLHAEHTFGSIYGDLSYYGGTRVSAAADDRPGMLKLGLRFPFTDNSSMGLDIINAGQRTGLEDPITLVRGEFKLNF